MELRSGKRKSNTAKSGSEWTEEDLEFFRVRFETRREFSNFFEEEPPQVFPGNIEDLLNIDLANLNKVESFDWDSLRTQDEERFVAHIFLVCRTHRNAENVVDQLAVFLFQLFGYDRRGIGILTHEKLRLDMCGGRTQAEADVCIERIDQTIKLLVREDKSYNELDINAERRSPEAQIVAGAIAAFQNNNRRRLERDEPALSSELIPCIVMRGTYPVFYRFEVTQQLAEAVRCGEEPETETLIQRYKIRTMLPPPPEALMINDYRRHIFQCYSAFRKFVWSSFPKNPKEP